jgi:2-polyprenyl-6-methoxyphenol hydroxylase-like FAD-dependent oxidoreductase
MNRKPIRIVGGGLAGLTLGIALRRSSVPVTVIEASHYPRHRVCGEFICGLGHDALANLGLPELLSRAGARPARTAMFQSARAASPVRPLPAQAISISRFVLDEALATQFRKLGGELEQNCRWTHQRFDEGTVRATGRRLPISDQPGQTWRWFGLKIHARNVNLRSDIEMHLANNGYVGVCRLPDNEANVCGLFRRASQQHSAGEEPRQLLLGNPKSGLRQRLADAEFDESSFCSVAGLSLEPVAARPDECCVGDALTMIPPVTGNGMSMAFESATLAVEPLVCFSESSCSWPEARNEIARRHRQAFSSRLCWAKWLHKFLFSNFFQLVDGSALRSELLWRTLFRHTR